MACQLGNLAGVRRISGFGNIGYKQTGMAGIGEWAGYLQGWGVLQSARPGKPVQSGFGSQSGRGKYPGAMRRLIGNPVICESVR